MNKPKSLLKERIDVFPNLNEEEYIISHGNYLFHDKKEFNNFNDIDDD